MAASRHVKGLHGKVPRLIKVGPFYYEVKRWKRMPADNSEAWGMCDRATNVILLSEVPGPQKQREVLLHEVLHAIYGTTGLCSKDNVPEEMVVTDMSPALLQVLRDNPDLVDYLVAVP